MAIAFSHASFSHALPHATAIGYSRPPIFLDFFQLLPSLPKMKKALVAGALGVTGRTLVNHLVSLGDWEVIGLSRRSPEFHTPAKYIAVDLSNRSAVESQLSGIGDVTHIFYAALYWGKNVFDEVGPNLAMLTNLVEKDKGAIKLYSKKDDNLTLGRTSS
jgi:hypothetical protein